MNQPLHLPLYEPPLPAPTLLQALPTFHPSSIILKLALPFNILFAILLTARHLPAIFTHGRLITTHLPLLFPALPLKLILLPSFLLTIIPVAFAFLVLLTSATLLSTLIPPLTTLGFPGAIAINILIYILILNHQRRPHRPRPRLVPPSPWPERPHISDFAHDDEMDNLRPLNPEWAMPEGLGTKGPQLRVGWENGLYRGVKVTGRRKMPPRVFLGKASRYHCIDIGEQRVEVGEDGHIYRIDVVESDESDESDAESIGSAW